LKTFGSSTGAMLTGPVPRLRQPLEPTYNSGMTVERKLATVLFVDLVGSTEFVSASDPEVVRRRVNAYFDRISHCVITHGGIVEKFAGDAVMAAFGIPQAHEDDAERAVRSALAMLGSIEELGLEARIGIESGEVVADDSESTFATGEAVNVAARLQQHAKPGEILIGPAAYRLTIGRLELEDAGVLELRGVPEPLPAWRVVCTLDGPRRRVLEAPFVGRESELELLENTYNRAVRDRRAYLFTVYGEPGVGKSRPLGGVRGVARGRHGADRTVPALRRVDHVLAARGDGQDLGWDLRRRPARRGDREAPRLLRGRGDRRPARARDPASCMPSSASAARRRSHGPSREWAEKLADAQPLVLVFEDIHWAEEPLLELIEHLADWVRERRS
jgi:class 3 adenylate cyclase